MKEFTRRIRLAWYHFRHGPGYRYHGLSVDIPDEMAFAFKRQLMQGEYEEPERRLVDRYLDPAVPAIELGGSLGILSAYVGHKLAPSTPYRVIEANPHIVEICRNNANRSRQGQPVEVVNAAVAYGSDTVSFAASPNVHISRVASGTSQGNVTVPATTLAREVDTLSGGGPYSLVMDIEGMEWDVFENEPEVLSRCAVAIVEFHPDVFNAAGNSVEGFFALAERAGLQVLTIDGNSAALAPRA